VEEIVQGCLNDVNQKFPGSTNTDSVRRGQFVACLNKHGINPCTKNKKKKTI